MTRACAAIIVMVCGCVDDPALPPADGGPDIDGMVDAPGPFDFYGEACTASPYPAITTCRGDRGWCIASVCRPQCGSDLPRCRAGVQHFSAGGACYCSPT